LLSPLHEYGHDNAYYRQPDSESPTWTARIIGLGGGGKMWNLSRAPHGPGIRLGQLGKGSVRVGTKKSRNCRGATNHFGLRILGVLKCARFGTQLLSESVLAKSARARSYRKGTAVIFASGCSGRRG
jgi:hypothetical protein